MKSLWSDAEAADFGDELALRAYTSRLLGRDRSLVLHGGGNTSVKLGNTLYVKGTGRDLAAVSESDFAPLDLNCARAVLDRPNLDNAEMMRLLDRCLAREPAPRPSVETLLHAALPHRYVEHTHADAVLAVVDTQNGMRIATEVFGDRALLVPYRHSGYELAKTCMEALQAAGTPSTIGLILQFHGVVAFGSSARESYENMIRLVDCAEVYLRARNAWEICFENTPAPARDAQAVARLRQSISRLAGCPLLMLTQDDDFHRAFAMRSDLASLTQQGPPTPQHAVYTKRIPLLGRDVEAYVQAYRDYLQRTLGPDKADGIDAAPRVVIDPQLGVCALGISAEHARMTAEFYRHDIEIMWRASAHDAYRSAYETAIALAELEYGGFERRLRAEAERTQPLLGRIALVAPAANRIEPHLAADLLSRGAAVVVAGPAEPCHSSDPAYLAVPWDADCLLEQAAYLYGGLDIVYAAPGDERWIESTKPLLELSPVGGKVIPVTDRAWMSAANP